MYKCLKMITDKMIDLNLPKVRDFVRYVCQDSDNVHSTYIAYIKSQVK